MLVYNFKLNAEAENNILTAVSTRTIWVNNSKFNNHRCLKKNFNICYITDSLIKHKISIHSDFWVEIFVVRWYTADTEQLISPVLCRATSHKFDVLNAVSFKSQNN
jgi:hypothetical protein